MSERREQYRYTWKESDEFHETIVTALADVTGAPETELPPLYDVIDTEAVADLLRRDQRNSDREPTTVSFTYLDYRITTRSDGSILIQPRDPGGS